MGQLPGTNPWRQRGSPVPADKPTLIVSSRALSSADKREKERDYHTAPLTTPAHCPSDTRLKSARL